MNLGFWLFPWTWGQDFLDTVVSFFYSILLTIDCIIYSFVSYVYKIFLVLAQGGKIFDDRMIDGLINRLYLILGVVMLFILAYSLLKSMINPDEIAKSKNSPIHIIRDVIIAIALIAFMPTIFNFAYSFQNSLLINNTIGKLIVGSATSNPEQTINNGGYTMAATIFKSFYHANATEEVVYCNDKDEEDDRQTLDGRACEPISVGDGQTWGELWKEAEKNSTFWVLGRAAPNILSGEVTYYFLIAPVAGIFVLFVLLTYCFDMALRLVKLAVYEIIAPIPVLARIVPNEQAKKVFNNWVKATITTFVEVFIRIAMLYFAVLLINTVVGSIDDLFKTSIKGGASMDVILLAKALIVVGIIMFVKQAPEIIKEITGLDSGKYNPFKAAKQGLSFLAGGIAGRTPLAAYRAMRQAGEAKDFLDFSAIGNQYRRREAKKEAKLQGAKTSDRVNDAIRKRFGFETKKERADRMLERGLDINGKPLELKNDAEDAIFYGYEQDENGNFIMEDVIVKDKDGNIVYEKNADGTDKLDANGNRIAKTQQQKKRKTLIAKDDNFKMSEEMMRQLQHEKDQLAIYQSAVDEKIRQIKDGQKVDQKFIDWRGKIKKKALEKINEGHNHIKRDLVLGSTSVALKDENGIAVLDANGNQKYEKMNYYQLQDYISKMQNTLSQSELASLTQARDSMYQTGFKGKDMNYAAMLAYKQGRINDGADASEISALEEIIKFNEDKMWVEYSNWAIKKDVGGEISTWYQQAVDYHDDVGMYDAKADKLVRYDKDDLQRQMSKISYHDDKFGDIEDNMAIFESGGIKLVNKDGTAFIDEDTKKQIVARGFDKYAKANANESETIIQGHEVSKIEFGDNAARIDRLLKQQEERKTLAKSSEEYTRYKASDNANKINDSGKK